jgi:hypothetical protein
LNRKLYVILENGLGNRLITLISVFRLALHTNREIVIVSKNDESFSGLITELLHLNLKEILLQKLPPYLFESIDSVKQIGGRSFFFDTDDVEILIKGWHHFLYSEKDLYILQNAGEDARLKIQSDLRATGRYLLQRHYRTSRFDLGLHIRSFTGIRDLGSHWETPSMEQLLRSISELIAPWQIRTVYLSTPLKSCRTEISRILSSMKVEIFISPAEVFDNSTSGLSEAIYDFISLLNSSKIIRSPLSTFSALPSFINGNLEAIYNDEGKLFIREPSLIHGYAL